MLCGRCVYNILSWRLHNMTHQYRLTNHRAAITFNFQWNTENSVFILVFLFKQLLSCLLICCLLYVGRWDLILLWELPSQTTCYVVLFSDIHIVPYCIVFLAVHCHTEPSVLLTWWVPILSVSWWSCSLLWGWFLLQPTVFGDPHSRSVLLF
jgi:hypothetical protein